MRKLCNRSLISTLLLIICVGGAVGTHDTFAHPGITHKAFQQQIRSGRRISQKVQLQHSTFQSQASSLSGSTITPAVVETQARTTAAQLQLHTEAAYRQHAPISRHSYDSPSVPADQSPGLNNSFHGLAQNCCQTADIALAASPQWVMQGVNTQIAVYTTRGVLQPGWPKSLASFFSVLSPSSCARTPAMSSPRAIYDFKDQRFWVAAIETEGATNSCPFKTLYWVAVSQGANPNGAWHIYAFDMASGTHNGANFTQFGLDGQAIYFSANMYDGNGRGNFVYSEIFASQKRPLENGAASINYYGFIGQMVGNIPVDTIQPVMVLDHDPGVPHAGLFVNSFNLRFGGGQCVRACSGLVVWTLNNPGQPNDSLTGVIVPTLNYSLALPADQPGCLHCLARLMPPDTRISGTPVYRHGLLSFALQTGINNLNHVVPGIFWGQVQPVFNANGTVTGGSVFQSGYFNYGGDGAALYPSLMVDNAGDLFMIFNYSSSRLWPGTAITARRSTFRYGIFQDGGIPLKAGEGTIDSGYWGTYTAAAYDGSASDTIWLSGQYATGQNSWSTFIGHTWFSHGAA